MRVVVHPDYASLTTWAAHLPATFDTSGTPLYVGRNAVRLFRCDGIDIVVKRYKRPNLPQRIAYTLFRPTKAARAFAFAAQFREAGIATPHEVAYIETRRCGLFAVGYFVSLFSPLPSLCEVFDTDAFEEKFHTAPAVAPHSEATLVEMRRQLAAFLVALHTKGILPGDLNLSNILFEEEREEDYRFSLIDTNRTHFRCPSRNECYDNLKRLTHRREVLCAIVEDYATLRGWDTETTVQAVLQRLEKFEQKKRTLYRFKRLLHKRTPL